MAKEKKYFKIFPVSSREDMIAFNLEIDLINSNSDIKKVKPVYYEDNKTALVVYFKAKLPLKVNKKRSLK